LDFDGDFHNNLQEWRTSTDPANGLSVLKMLTPASDVSGMTISWQSVSGVNFFLQRSADFGAQTISL
jgi:hypothetical protein